MWTAVTVFVSALTAPASSGGSPLPPFTCADLASNDTYHLSFQGSWTYRSLNPQVRKHSELLIIVIICLEYIYYKTEYVRMLISSCSCFRRYVWWKNSVCKIPARLTLISLPVISFHAASCVRLWTDLHLHVQRLGRWRGIRQSTRVVVRHTRQ